ncbi:MAG: YicC/YloC family endoribonuclease [Pseudomonadota bacterium]|nr:YicC/YloC family endoribonuclease [Pseudomonadota bacterium]
MTFQSMTGFARSEGRVETETGTGHVSVARWVWEIRSVNAKSLDMRLRLPPGFEEIEPECRKAIAGKLTRGSVQAGLRVDQEQGAELPVINHAALEAVLAAVESLRTRLGSPPPAAEAILALRGVIEPGGAWESDETRSECRRAVLAGLDDALTRLVAARADEGGKIVRVLAGQVDRIAALTQAVEVDPSRSPEAIGERIAAQLEPLLDRSELDPQRLHQEAAILATRADLREEIDRLHAHVQAARDLLSTGAPVGRRLDFLAQEFNRECNTVCSKSNAASVTTLGLEMKLVIDQFREQVQNLE